MAAQGRRKPGFFALRTTAGQEYNVAMMLYNRLKSGKYKVYSVIVVPGVKGLVIVEADAQYEAQRAAYGLKHFKGMISGRVRFEEITKLLKPKPMIEQLSVGDIVEVVRGPFSGMRGKVIEIDRGKNEIRIEIAEAAFPLPTIINAEDVKIVQKAKKEE